jgi:hypothetical protein
VNERFSIAAGYDFSPVEGTVDGADVDVPEIVVTQALVVEVVLTITGDGKENALVTLTGDVVYSDTTNADGLVVFTGVADGEYTITVAQDGYSYYIDEPTGEVAGEDLVIGGIIGSEVTLSGQVVDGTDAGIEGVLVTITGGQTDTTDVDGNWSIGPVVDGTYTVTPAKADTEFIPTSQSALSVARASIVTDDFVGVGSSGLVLHWPLLGGSSTDASGKGHDGTISDSLAGDMTDPAGVTNNAHTFTGSQSVWIADHADLDFGTGAFSLAFWACTTNGGAITAGPGSIVGKNKVSGVSPAGEYKWILGVDARAASRNIRLWQDVSTTYVTALLAMAEMASGGLGTGVWAHFAFTRSATGVCQIYYQGTVHELPGDAFVADCAASFSNDRKFNVGLMDDGTDIYGWKGGIAHVRVYKGYVLTESDVATLIALKI